MNKNRLIEVLAFNMFSSRMAAEVALESLLELIMEELQRNGDRKLTITNFGTFYAKTKSPTRLWDPAGMRWRKVPEHRVVVFKPAKIFREQLNEPNK